jgi:hypothetical protein
MADNPRKVEAERPTKLVDYYTNPQYDHCVILFYDVLGWRNEIEIAGKQPEKIGNLRRLILQHSRSLRLPTATPVNVSTFSDNCPSSEILGQEAA